MPTNHLEEMKRKKKSVIAFTQVRMNFKRPFNIGGDWIGMNLFNCREIFLTFCIEKYKDIQVHKEVLINY